MAMLYTPKPLQMCSWCHESTRLDYCPNCGHLAGIPRVLCSCPKCRPRNLDGSIPMTDGQREAMEATLKLWRSD
jgi:hypothetical protein